MFGSIRRALLVTLLVPATFVGSSSVALASDTASPGTKICQKLECSEDQKDDVKKIVENLRKDLQAERSKGQNLRATLAEEFKKDKLDQASIKKLREDLNAHRKRVEDKWFQAFGQLHKLLAPEQRKKLSNFFGKLHLPGLEKADEA